MRLKADSDRVKEVCKELSAFATRRHTNGNSMFIEVRVETESKLLTWMTNLPIGLDFVTYMMIQM